METKITEFLASDTTIEIYRVLTTCQALWTEFTYINSFNPHHQLCKSYYNS